jgi:hypothetical protein
MANVIAALNSFDDGYERVLAWVTRCHREMIMTYHSTLMHKSRSPVRVPISKSSVRLLCAWVRPFTFAETSFCKTRKS